MELPKGLRYIFWNVRSVFNKIDSIRDFVERYKPDILCINESWLRDDVPSHLVDIKDYALVRNDRTTVNNRGFTKRGGGLLTYISHRIMYEIVDNELTTICTRDLETSVVRISLRYTRPIYLVNIYLGQ